MIRDAQIAERLEDYIKACALVEESYYQGKVSMAEAFLLVCDGYKELRKELRGMSSLGFSTGIFEKEGGK